MLDPQNFSIHANARVVVAINVDPNDEITLVGATIEWNLYAQEFGRPTGSALVSKDNRVDGTIVVADPEEMVFEFPLESSDTRNMAPGNYYHEATVVDVERGNIPVAYGIATVLETKNRPEETTT